MRHEAGLANFDTSIDLQDLFAENIKQNAIGRIIEGHAPDYASGGGDRRQYHALTRGWIVNELFRRVDPAGRTIGEYVREEISGPLDVVIGVRDDQMERVSRVTLLGLGAHLAQSLLPRVLGRGVVHNIFQILGRLLKLIPMVFRARKMRNTPPFADVDGMGFVNNPRFLKGETPSANANCSARGLAKVAAMMSARGKFAGREFIGERGACAANKSDHGHYTHHALHTGWGGQFYSV